MGLGSACTDAARVLIYNLLSKRAEFLSNTEALLCMSHNFSYKSPLCGTLLWLWSCLVTSFMCVCVDVCHGEDSVFIWVWENTHTRASRKCELSGEENREWMLTGVIWGQRLSSCASPLMWRKCFFPSCWIWNQFLAYAEMFRLNMSMTYLLLSGETFFIWRLFLMDVCFGNDQENNFWQRAGKKTRDKISC